MLSSYDKLKKLKNNISLNENSSNFRNIENIHTNINFNSNNNKDYNDENIKIDDLEWEIKTRLDICLG